MINNLIKTALLFSALILISGCATSRQWAPGIDYSNNAGNCPVDKACIYVIRPASFVGSALHFVVSDDTGGIGITGPSSYLAWQRNPGPVKLESQAENDAKLQFIAEAGQTYYIMQSVEPGFITGRNALKLIPKEQAIKYLESCKPADKNS